MIREILPNLNVSQEVEGANAQTLATTSAMIQGLKGVYS